MAILNVDVRKKTEINQLLIFVTMLLVKAIKWRIMKTKFNKNRKKSNKKNEFLKIFINNKKWKSLEKTPYNINKNNIELYINYRKKNARHCTYIIYI